MLIPNKVFKMCFLSLNSVYLMLPTYLLVCQHLEVLDEWMTGELGSFSTDTG